MLQLILTVGDIVIVINYLRIHCIFPLQILMSVQLVLITVTPMLTALTITAVFHVPAYLDTLEMESTAKVRNNIYVHVHHLATF